MPTAPSSETRGRVAKTDVLRGASSGRNDLGNISPLVNPSPIIRKAPIGSKMPPRAALWRSYPGKGQAQV